MPTQVVKPKKLFIPIIAILGMVLILTGLFNLTGMFNNDNTNSAANPLILWAPEVQAQTVCTYYASPTGGGNGSSQSSPFQIADFWKLGEGVIRGKTLCLLDGKYTGSESMIDPPDNLHGTESQRIVVKSLNDGKIEIDGENNRRPVYLLYNDWYIIEGINAHSSDKTVVEISRSNNNIIRRVVAWDASDGNYNIFAAHYGEYNVFEDCAGWGIARKTFSNSQGGDHTTFRRCFARWEYCSTTGPKMAYTLMYNSYYALIENSIGTWDNTDPSTSHLQEPYGIYSIDRQDGDKNTHSKILGSIAYLENSQTCTKIVGGFFMPVSNTIDIEIKDCVSYIEPGTHSDFPPFYFRNSGQDLTADNITSFGERLSVRQSDWKVSNYLEGASPADAYGSMDENIFNATHGARICNRYIDGQLTDEALWPWPMNQRIIDAMNRYYDLHPGVEREPVDVTATIEEIFGPIPAECKTGGGQPQPSITLTKSASPLSATPGQTITYTIHYSNTGTVAADSTVIKDIIPTGTQFVTGSVQASHSSGSCSYDLGNRTLTCSYPTIPVGASGDIRFEARVE